MAYKIINDLGYNKRQLRSFFSAVKTKVPWFDYPKNTRMVPLHPRITKINKWLEAEKPDLIILPQRGAEIFAQTIPKALKKKAVLIPISEGLARRGRIGPWVGPLYDKIGSNTHKVVFLDDVVCSGGQASRVKETIDLINPKTKFVVMALSGPKDMTPADFREMGLKKCRFTDKGARTLSFIVRRDIGWDRGDLPEKEHKKYIQRRMQMHY